jgi:hypothetical protein
MTNEPVPQAGKPSGSSRELKLKYAGACSLCQARLSVGTKAIYDFSTGKVRCIVCRATDDPGTPGGSAQREYERRKANQAAKVKSQLGEIMGGVILATTSEPQSTLAWAQGARGEQKLAQILTGIPGIKLLHDRQVPHTRGNLDHIVVAPAGVFVIDAKLLKGLIHIRNVGGFFKTDRRLFVGSRDRSRLTESMSWQVERVESALFGAGFGYISPIVPVICFVDGTWPRHFLPPQAYNGVWLEDGGSIMEFLSGKPVFNAELVSRVHHALALAFPAK